MEAFVILSFLSVRNVMFSQNIFICVICTNNADICVDECSLKRVTVSLTGPFLTFSLVIVIVMALKPSSGIGTTLVLTPRNAFDSLIGQWERLCDYNLQFANEGTEPWIGQLIYPRSHSH